MCILIWMELQAFPSVAIYNCFFFFSGIGNHKWQCPASILSTALPLCPSHSSDTALLPTIFTPSYSVLPGIVPLGREELMGHEVSLTVQNVALTHVIGEQLITLLWKKILCLWLRCCSGWGWMEILNSHVLYLFILLKTCKIVVKNSQYRLI